MNPADIKHVRIDKFLWAARIFKTRSQASDACRKGRVMIDNNVARPSRIIEGKEIITVKKPPVTYTYRVICLLANRIPAKLTGDFIEDLTPEDEKQKLLFKRVGHIGYRKKGSGRPTKKERRTIDKWTNGLSDY